MLILIAVCLAAPSPAWCQDQNQGPSARAGVFVFEPSGEGDSKKVQAKSFGAGVPPGPGKHLRVFADASIPAVVLIAAFDKGKSTLYGGVNPILVELKKAYTEADFPGGTETALGYEAEDTPYEIIVAVIEKSDTQIETLKKLLRAMKEADKDESLLSLQSAELKKMIDGWIRNSSRSTVTVPYAPPSIAAVRRAATGAQIEWREHVYRREFQQASPGVFVFPVPAEK